MARRVHPVVDNLLAASLAQGDVLADRRRGVLQDLIAGHPGRMFTSRLDQLPRDLQRRQAMLDPDGVGFLDDVLFDGYNSRPATFIPNAAGASKLARVKTISV